MVIATIIISAVLGYYFAVFIKNKKVGYPLSFTFIALFILSLVLLVSNEYSHFGMEKVTSEKVYQIQIFVPPILKATTSGSTRRKRFMTGLCATS